MNKILDAVKKSTSGLRKMPKVEEKLLLKINEGFANTLKVKDFTLQGKIIPKECVSQDGLI